MTIDWNKPVETVDGLEVRIYATDGAEPFPIHGAIRCSSGWESQRWTGEGKRCDYNNPVEFDLRNKPEEVVRWCSVYGSNFWWGRREFAIIDAEKSCTGASLLKLTFIDGKLVKAELEDV